MYNKAVGLQEGLDEKFANVQSAYQRRADLIPNLLETVKGAAQNEKDILTQVTQARAGIVGAKTPEDLELMGRKINTAINLAYEAYPQIRSTENFSQFQNQLEGTENRIKTERDRYNESVKEYNTHIRGFFARFFLSFFAGRPFGNDAGCGIGFGGRNPFGTDLLRHGGLGGCSGQGSSSDGSGVDLGLHHLLDHGSDHEQHEQQEQDSNDATVDQ